MFDFTKEVQLEEDWQLRYRWLKSLIYAGFLLAAGFFLFAVFFPSRTFIFLFTGPDQSRSSIANVRETDMKTLQNGQVSAGPLQFDVFWDESPSDVTINLYPQSNSSNLTNSPVRLRKTYKAFTYPLASKPAPLPDGSLIKYQADLYIISEGKRRQFPSPTAALALGFSPEKFLEASAEDLELNETGDPIGKEHPNSSLFKIKGNFYRLHNQVLEKFVSQQAFLADFRTEQAIEQDENFLNRYPLAKQTVGFPSGTLLSFDISAFIVVDDKIRPFNNPRTFLAFGFDWNDILPANQEEIGLYERAKIFDANQPHPNGTIFASKENGTYFLISDGQRREIRGGAALAIYLRRNPIIVSESSLEFADSCLLKKEGWLETRYTCTIPLERLGHLQGNDYQFEIRTPSGTSLDSMDTVFSRSANKDNLKLSLLNIKAKILLNYGYGPK